MAPPRLFNHQKTLTQGQKFKENEKGEGGFAFLFHFEYEKNHIIIDMGPPYYLSLGNFNGYYSFYYYFTWDSQVIFLFKSKSLVWGAGTKNLKDPFQLPSRLSFSGYQLPLANSFHLKLKAKPK